MLDPEIQSASSLVPVLGSIQLDSARLSERTPKGGLRAISIKSGLILNGFRQCKVKNESCTLIDTNRVTGRESHGESPGVRRHAFFRSKRHSPSMYFINI